MRRNRWLVVESEVSAWRLPNSHDFELEHVRDFGYWVLGAPEISSSSGWLHELQCLGHLARAEP